MDDDRSTVAGFVGGTGSATVFPTCLAEQLRPSLARTVADLLGRHGVNATVSHRTTCCGQPAWNSGLVAEARRVARHTLRALARTRQAVVVPSGSCATMMREHWPELFRGTRDESAARDVADRVREFSEFLAPLVQDAAPAVDRVAYHDSCHMLRELGVRAEPRQVLASAGTVVDEMPTWQLCCGFGGTFSVKLPEISAAMADEKLDSVAAIGADVLVGCDLSCLMHLEGRAERRGMRLKTRHLAEHVADAGTPRG
ncbi:MAG: (Fe-S)-binding protein [Candidatus Dormibacteria bacterium]